MSPVYREINKVFIEWPEKASWTNMLDSVWNRNAFHEHNKDSQTAWRQEWTYHPSVSGGNKLTGAESMKFTKNDYLIRSQLSLILALPLIHFAYLMLKSVLSTLRWLLQLLLGYLSYLLSFLSEWLSKTSNYRALFFHNLAHILTVWRKWASQCKMSKHLGLH